MAKTKMSHAHRIAQTNHVKLTVIKTPTYLQIDGEGWLIEKPMSMEIVLYDQLPTLIGYKFPRGVYYKYDNEYYTDKIKKKRHRFRKTIKMKYNIPSKFTNSYDPGQRGLGFSYQSNLNLMPLTKQKSTDDFDVEYHGDSMSNVYIDNDGAIKEFEMDKDEDDGNQIGYAVTMPSVDEFPRSQRSMSGGPTGLGLASLSSKIVNKNKKKKKSKKKWKRNRDSTDSNHNLSVNEKKNSHSRGKSWF